MITDDQVSGKQLQYDINREAAKISALSSGKINKYEYLIGEEILPSNQKQIIQQAKFTYPPLGKGFEKQIKTFEDQGNEQVDDLKDLTKAIKGKSNEIFNRLLDERMKEVQKLSKEIDFNNLIYYFKGQIIAPITFIRFRGSLNTFKGIKKR